MRRIGSCLVMSAAVLLLVPACGGSGGARALSKPDFISKGDAICKSVNDKTATQDSPKDAKAASTLLATDISLTRDLKSKFGALDPPSDGKQLQKDFIAQVDKVLASADKAKAKADAGDLQGAGAEMDKIDTSDIDTRMKDYGFKDCSNDGSGDTSGASGN